MNHRSNSLLTILIAGLVFIHFGSANLIAQQARLFREVVHAKSVGKTATGENPDRQVSVYLPPSYFVDKEKKYPVVYLLHGIGDNDQTWTQAWTQNGQPGANGPAQLYATIPDVMDRGIADKTFGEMIVVMPDQRTKCFGSFYVNSAATGNWEDFTAKELVKYIDEKYRTLASPNSRGITGHSMGGYGALTLSMKHPDVFSVAYGMNSAITGWTEEISLKESIPRYQAIEDATSFNDFQMPQELLTVGMITLGQAFSPNPDKPPFYADLPYKKVDGKWRPSEPAFSKWRSHSPIRMVEKYRDNLFKLRGIRFDSGYDDEFRFIPVNSRLLSLELTNNGVEHIFEEYDGDHRNKMWGKTGRVHSIVMPYFWKLLEH